MIEGKGGVKIVEDSEQGDCLRGGYRLKMIGAKEAVLLSQLRFVDWRNLRKLGKLQNVCGKRREHGAEGEPSSSLYPFAGYPLP